MSTYKSSGSTLTEAQRRFLSNQLGADIAPKASKPMLPKPEEEKDTFEYNTFLEDDESGLDVSLDD